MARTDASVPIQQPTAFLCSVYDEEREERLAARYNRKAPAPLVFEFTRDPALLHQYCRIRAQEYKIVGGVQMPATASEYDHSSHLLIVRKGNFCVGGIRINIKNPRKNNLLPMEIDDFRLEKHFPQLLHKQMGYCQFGMLVLLPEFRGIGITTELFRRVHNKAVALNCKMMFALAPASNTRLYKWNFSSIGLEEITYPDIELPVYPRLEHIKNCLFSVATKEWLVMEADAPMVMQANRQLEDV